MSRSRPTYALALALALALGACDKTPPITDDQLDGEVIFDPSLNDPDAFLVSARGAPADAADLSRPVLIAAHGYSASTAEWAELDAYAAGAGFEVSRVLLGGHGRTYADFRASRWEDWRESVTREYEALVALGYTDVSLAGSSTGGTLLLELLQSGYFDARPAPRHVFLVDAIVLPSVKLQSLAGIVGPALVYVETDQSAAEDRVYYRFRPEETVRELNELIEEVRKGLEAGVTLPQNTTLTVFHAERDPTANVLSAVLIARGVTGFGASPAVEVSIVDSDLHVFTRLDLREGVTPADRARQAAAFEAMGVALGG